MSTTQRLTVDSTVARWIRVGDSYAGHTITRKHWEDDYGGYSVHLFYIIGDTEERVIGEVTLEEDETIEDVLQSGDVFDHWLIKVEYSTTAQRTVKHIARFRAKGDPAPGLPG